MGTRCHHTIPPDTRDRNRGHLGRLTGIATNVKYGTKGPTVGRKLLDMGHGHGHMLYEGTLVYKILFTIIPTNRHLIIPTNRHLIDEGVFSIFEFACLRETRRSKSPAR